MNKTTTTKPKFLPRKLRQIRSALRLDQKSMLGWLELGEVSSNYVSELETGKRSPSQAVLERYSQMAGVEVEALVNDDLELPDDLPRPQKTTGVPRSSGKRRRSS